MMLWKNTSLRYGLLTGAALALLVFVLPKNMDSPPERMPASEGESVADGQSPPSIEAVLERAQKDRRIVGSLIWAQSYDPSLGRMLLSEISALGFKPEDVAQRLTEIAQRKRALYDIPSGMMKTDPAMARDRMMGNELGVYFALRTLTAGAPQRAEPLLEAEATECKTAIPCAGGFHGMLDLASQPSGAAWSAVKNAFGKPLLASAAAVAVIGAKGSCELEGAWLLPRITLEAKDDFVFKQHAIRALAKLQCKAAIPELQRILEWSVANPNARGSAPLHDASAAALVSLGAR